MQEHRRDNLRALLRELAQGGLTGLDAQASFLVTGGATLKNMLGRAVIGDRFAVMPNGPCIGATDGSTKTTRLTLSKLPRGILVPGLRANEEVTPGRLEQRILAVLWFWRDLEYLRCHSLRACDQSTLRHLDAE